jgi:site-specific DNA-methyltransferase (adenine-specific)
MKIEEMLNKVICGDCLEVMKDIPDKSIDLIITDPPYGIKISSNPFRQKFPRKQWDNFTPSQEYFDEMFRIAKNVVCFGGNYFSNYLPQSKGFFIWDKGQPEKFSSAMVEYIYSSKNKPAKMFRQKVNTYPKFHPTTKPVNLIEWILSYYPECKTVLDPFAGSGTTGVACKNLNRNYILIEKEPEYIDIINKRLNTLNQDKLL